MNAIPSRVAFDAGQAYRKKFPTIPSRSLSRYRPSGPDYVDRFYARLRKWESETYYASSPVEFEDHPDLRAIVRMGYAVVPLILDELRRKPSMLLIALHKITGEIPFGAEDKGNLKAMSNAWLAWGQRHSGQ